jgi:hypothetical protein
MSDRTTEQQRGITGNPSDGAERYPKLPFTEIPRRPIKAGRGIRNLDPKLADNELPRRPIKAGRVRNLPERPPT